MKTELSRRIPLPPIKQMPFDYAVQFGAKKRSQDQQAYPFFYNFIRYPYQVGTPDDSFGANQATGIYRVTADAAEGPDGLSIPSFGVLDIPIVMDHDTNFHLLYAKFGAFRKLDDTGTVNASIITPASGYVPPNNTTIRVVSTSGNTVITTNVYYVINATATIFQLSLSFGGAAISFGASTGVVYVIQDGRIGSREYMIFPYTDANPSAAGQGLVPEAARNARIPYWTELDVSLYMPSSMSRDVYGGFQRLPIGGATLEAPIPILDLQGSQDGLGMIRTPFQLTKSATVLIRVTSRSAYPLRVYGHLFGYKITV